MAKALMRHTDPWSAAVILLTLILFLIALFVKGFTHDLLLEAGVFLVSVKLIMMGYNLNLAAERNEQRLQAIETLLRSSADRNTADPNTAQVQSSSHRAT